MRLFPLLVLSLLLAVSSRSQPSGETSVLWIYDCSQSHYYTLVPPTVKGFGAPTAPIDQLI